MFAALPMYDRPENAAAHDALWALIRDGLRARGVAAPDALDRTVAHDEGWARADLVLGQICNLPWRARFRDRVTLIGASDYGLPGAGPGRVLQPDRGAGRRPRAGPPLRAQRPAVELGLGRRPGLGAGRRACRSAPVLVTGSHRESMRAVAEGRADLAAIDAVTWRDAGAVGARRGSPARGRPHRATPGQSLITGRGPRPRAVPRGLAEALAALPRARGGTARPARVVPLPLSAYDIPLPPEPVLAA